MCGWGERGCCVYQRTSSVQFKCYRPFNNYLWICYCKQSRMPITCTTCFVLFSLILTTVWSKHENKLMSLCKSQKRCMLVRNSCGCSRMERGLCGANNHWGNSPFSPRNIFHFENGTNSRHEAMTAARVDGWGTMRTKDMVKGCIGVLIIPHAMLQVSLQWPWRLGVKVQRCSYVY